MLTLSFAQNARFPNPDHHTRREKPVISLLDLLVMKIDVLDLDFRSHRLLKEIGRGLVHQVATFDPNGPDRPTGFGGVCRSHTSRALQSYDLSYCTVLEPQLMAEIERHAAIEPAPQDSRMSPEKIEAEDAKLLERRREFELAILVLDAKRAALWTVPLDFLPSPLPPRAKKAYDKMRKLMGL